MTEFDIFPIKEQRYFQTRLILVNPWPPPEQARKIIVNNNYKVIYPLYQIYKYYKVRPKDHFVQYKTSSCWLQETAKSVQRILNKQDIMATTNELSQLLISLHQRSNKPLVLANIYDIISAKTVANLPSCEALATASYAIAEAAGTTDDDMTLSVNLAAVKGIAAVARKCNKPLTVDIQDGYGEQLEEAIEKLLEYGVAGINLEDHDKTNKKMYDVTTAVSRIRRVLEVARKRNVPEFVINARCDALVAGGGMEEVLSRGKRYLEAGATTVFVWGGKRGVSKSEVERMVKVFDGRLNVMLKLSSDGLAIKQLAEIGVARISVGPALQVMAMEALKSQAENLLS